MRALIFVMVAAACSTQPDEGNVSEGARALGIASFEVSNTTTTLTIVGRDVIHRELARLDLAIGRVTIEDDDRGEVYGRNMTVKVLEQTVRHQSEGLMPLLLPLEHRSPKVQAFLLDPQVSSVLAQWGIGLDATGSDVTANDISALTGETALMSQCQIENGTQPQAFSSSTGPCTSCTYSNACGDVMACRQFFVSGPNYGQFVCCRSTQRATERRCSSPGANAGCGTNGPNGCSPCWGADYYSSWDVPGCAVSGAALCAGSYCPL